MVYTDFIREFAEEANITKKDAAELVKAYETVAYNHITDEDGVVIMKGLTLSTTTRDAHIGRNPSTGEEITIPAKVVPKAKFGKKFKDFVNA